MPSRRYIVKHDLQKYDVDKDIPEILDSLAFREIPTQLDAWKLFCRKGKTNEFAGIYKNEKGENKFLLEGPYSNLDVPKRDLETIEKRIFNEGWFSRTARKSLYTPFLIPLGILAVGLYDGFLGNHAIGNAIREYAKLYPKGNHDPLLNYFILSIGGSAVAGAVIREATGGILNIYYGSKLSKEAEDYLYGRNAETRLELESIFENIKSGKIKKEKFLDLIEGAL